MSLVTQRPRPATAPPSHRPRRRGVRAWVRGLLAAVTLLGIVAGVPVLLVALGSALPVDLGLLAAGAWTGPADGGLLLLVLLGVAWGAWAAMLATVAVELWGAVRHVPAPQLPGLAGPQRLAAALVAAALLVPGGAWTSTAAGVGGAGTGAASLGELVTVMTVAGADDVPVLDRGFSARADGLPGQSGDADARPDHAGDQAAEDASRPGSSAARALPTVEVERHDTLWQLAERHLGDGERFMEIVALNAGVEQSDGRALGSDGRLYPGWVLQLPASEDTAGRGAAKHRVAPGETLWEVAQEHLGEGNRYREVFDANRDRLQADGDRLVDPDLIRPGWVLALPGAEPDAPADPLDAPDVPTEPEPEPEAPAAESGDEGPSASVPLLDRVDAVTPGPEDTVLDRPVLDRPVLDRPVLAGPVLDRPAPAGFARDVPPPPAPLGQPHDHTEAAGLPAELPAGGALSALLLAAMAGELARRRRRFQRLRHPGERMPQPTADQRALEQAARAAVADGAGASAELLGRALAQLGRQAARTGVPLPAVRVVRAGPDAITLDLADPSNTIAPIAPFTAGGDRCWVLDVELLEEAALDEPSADTTSDPAGADDAEAAAQGDAELDLASPAPALPGLVPIGTAGPDTVLVDLTTVGTLHVAGPRAAVADAMRGLTAELALGAGVAGSARSACLVDPMLVGAAEPGAMVSLDPTGAAKVLTAAALAVPGVDPVELVVADAALDVAPPQGRADGTPGPAGLITSAPVASAGATLRLDGVGGAVLEPHGLVVRPSALPVADAEALLGLLAATDVPDDADPSPAHREDAITAAAPRLLVLGQLRVEGAAGRVESTRVGRLAEAAAFVHLNPGSRPSALQSALWPGVRSNPQTCRQLITRARTWLGRTEGGEPYLMQLSETGGVLQLRPAVTSDWDDFQRLAEQGLADPQDTAALSEALRLVRGRPFGPVAGRELPWTDLHVNTMIELIVDVAHELALRHEQAGNASAARDAALRGLRTECESEALQAIVTRLGRRS